MKTCFSFLGKQVEKLEIGSSYQRIQLKGFLLFGLYVAQVMPIMQNGFDEA